MARWTPQQRDLLEFLADEFLYDYGTGRTLLAVDGIDCAGKTRFADALAGCLGRGGHMVFRASIDGFHRPSADRYAKGRDSAEGYYRDSFDYDLFRRVLIEPFRLGSTGFITATFDWRRDSPVEMDCMTGPQDATLVLDGIFLNRPELRGLWDYSIWLDLPEEVAARRMIERDGPSDREARYRDGQRLYIFEASPQAAASVIIDNSDFERPRRISSPAGSG